MWDGSLCVCRGYLSEVHCLAMFEVLSSNTAIERPKMVQVLVLGAIPKAVGLVVEVGVEEVHSARHIIRVDTGRSDPFALGLNPLLGISNAGAQNVVALEMGIPEVLATLQGDNEALDVPVAHSKCKLCIEILHPILARLEAVVGSESAAARTRLRRDRARHQVALACRVVGCLRVLAGINAGGNHTCFGLCLGLVAACAGLANRRGRAEDGHVEEQEQRG